MTPRPWWWRPLRFFGQTLFFGVGTLIVSPVTITLNLSASHGRIHGLVWIPIGWAAVGAVWTLLGMLGRTFAWR